MRPGLRAGKRASRLAGPIIGAMLVALATFADAAAQRAIVLEVDGVIGPGMADYVVRTIDAATPRDTGLVVLRLDTPGGLDTSMREIIRAMLASPVPVAVYVAPSGARAASAGAYITYAAGVAAMAPGTNIGAATPIQLGAPSTLPGDRKEGDTKSKGQDTESRKMISDAVAYIQSLAHLHGRNAEWATEAVREAASLPAPEALKQKVIDVIADDVPDLLRKIDGRTAIVAGQARQLTTAGLEVVTVGPDWRTRLLTIITNPNVAYLLMLLGAYGLIFELSNPGAVLPGVVGTISILVALFALNMLPIDYAGAALVLLGIALMVAEVFIGSFGVIGAGGIAAFAIGSIIMFQSNAPGFTLSVSLVIAATAVTAGFLALVLVLLLRSRRRRVVTGSEAMIGAEGETVEWHGDSGRIRIMGEIWKAHAGQPLTPGARIRVVSRKDLVLTVEPM
ncbi:nodulation protein NfeD [Reyranella sp.]|jgi:membrane-bound serine protease (ClpP class)|uniref:NfeD family protein n=1 Tax=Reyranella sp. TaxID=1929291 RepID=UPI002F927107